MKKLLSITFLLLIQGCTKSNNSKTIYNADEILFVVEMESNEGKSVEDIREFSKFYTEAIDLNEPYSLGWGFYDSGDKIILIERYFNGDAMIQH
tara:strand:+ start:246 stop:527 length:282 start_codon:yes stop_codon:yes gene_type:complete